MAAPVPKRTADPSAFPDEASDHRVFAFAGGERKCYACYTVEDTAHGGARLRRCGGCLGVWYCDVECQRIMRPWHRVFCLTEEAAKRAFANSALPRTVDECVRTVMMSLESRTARALLNVAVMTTLPANASDNHVKRAKKRAEIALRALVTACDAANEVDAMLRAHHAPTLGASNLGYPCTDIPLVLAMLLSRTPMTAEQRTAAETMALMAKFAMPLAIPAAVMRALDAFPNAARITEEHRVQLERWGREETVEDQVDKLIIRALDARGLLRAPHASPALVTRTIDEVVARLTATLHEQSAAVAAAEAAAEDPSDASDQPDSADAKKDD